MHKGHNFRYVQFETAAGIGYACVSFDWDKSDGQIKYSAGVVFCNPVEKRFNKDRARRQADVRREGQRLKSAGMSIRSKVSATDTSRFVSNAEFDSVLRNIFIVASKRDMVPNWASKALRDNKVRFGLHQERVVTGKLSADRPRMSMSVCTVLPSKRVSGSTERI